MYGVVFVEVCWVTQARLGEGSEQGVSPNWAAVSVSSFGVE